MATLDTAYIIAVGTELLTPTRTDTNSLAITERLNALGVEVLGKMVVGDRPDELSFAIRGAMDRARLVMLCGGLGPTDDDITRDVTSAILDRPLDEDPKITEAIRSRFTRRGMAMPEINRRQAMVPRGAEVLENRLGTAPGLWVEHGDGVVVLLPGPPRELLALLDGAVVDRLRTRVPGSGLYRRVVRVVGRTESHVEEAARPLYAAWAAEQRPLAATILAARGAIDLHLTARASTADEGAAILDRAAGELRQALGAFVYSDRGQALEEVVGDLLRQRHWRIALAESCTGGLVAKRLTDVPGSSAYVELGAVVYSNEAKTRVAGVPADLIATYGAVSEQVAAAMAEGIRAMSGAEIGVGVTGIAGPGGGTATKPVGTVVFAISGPSGAAVRTRQLYGDRELIRALAANLALEMIRRLALDIAIP